VLYGARDAMMPHETRLLLMLTALMIAGGWVWLAARQERIPALAAWQPNRASFTLTFSRRRAILLVAGVAILLLVTLDGLTNTARTGTEVLAIGWVIGCGLALTALAGPDEVRAALRHLRASLHTHRTDWLWAGGLLLLALSVRVIGLNEHPIYLTVDEQSFWDMAMDAAFGGHVSPFATGWYQHPYMMMVWQGWSIDLLGNTVGAYRLPSAIVGALSIPALYGLACTLFDRRAARWSAAVLALLPVHVMFSRHGLNQVGDALFTLLAAIFYLRALRYGRAVDYVLFGALLGMAQFFYAAGLFSVVMFALLTLYMAWRDGVLVFRQADAFVLAGAAFLLVTLPYYGHLLYNGQPLLPRADVYISEPLGDSPTVDNLIHALNISWGTFTEYAGRVVHEALYGLGQGLRDVYSVYFATFDMGRYQFARLPLLGMVSLPPFFVGLWLAVRRWRDPRVFLPLLFLLLIPAPTLLAFPVPDYFRFVLALPFAALLIGWGLCTVWDVLRIPRRVIAALVIAALLAEVGAYALTATPSWATLRQREALFTAIGADVAAAPRTAHFYLVMPEEDTYPQWGTAIKNALVDTRVSQLHLLEQLADLHGYYACHTEYIFYIEPAQLAAPDALDGLYVRFPNGTFAMQSDDAGAPLFGRFEGQPTCAASN
jgi:4-amino-4-deoxy-L-arabinose transferase-like glycosyltransferase